MKHSIRGKFNKDKSDFIVEQINKFILWRLVTNNHDDKFIFEAWVNSISDATTLFNLMKLNVTGGEFINRHECTHDEESSLPCTIVEEYRG